VSKQITAGELASIVQTLLCCPEVHIGLDDARFSAMMTDIAMAVCRHAGGEPLGVAELFEDDWYISIVRNEHLPEDGGIWADYDLDGELEPYSVFAWGD